MENATTTRGRAKQEVHTGVMETQKLDDIVMPGLDEPIVKRTEAIEPVDTHINKDYFEELAFMEEMVTIRLEPSREPNAPKLIDVYVNGIAEWIPVGKPWMVKRKYVEVLARSKPIGISTVTGSMDEANPENRIVRTVVTQHPFSVIKDTDKGFAWLTKIMQEG